MPGPARQTGGSPICRKQRLSARRRWNTVPANDVFGCGQGTDADKGFTNFAGCASLAAWPRLSMLSSLPKIARVCSPLPGVLRAEDRDLLRARSDARAREIYEMSYSARGLYAKLTEDAICSIPTRRTSASALGRPFGAVPINPQGSQDQLCAGALRRALRSRRISVP
jgi:hypothetical protein